jgi:capsular exopolysaccharide synthesis family protein
MRAMELRAFGAPLEPAEKPVPEPGPGEVRVRVQACGVCGSDLFLQKGGFGRPLPIVPGHEASGVVDAVGTGVEGWRPGEQAALYYITTPPDDPWAARGVPNRSPDVVRMGVDVDGAFAEYVLRPADALIRAPASAYGEALRTARAGILGADGRGSPQVIAFLSALPGEGKTTTALAFGRMLALNESKVLLIDGDLRRAGLRHVTGQAPEIGLFEVLTDDLSPEQAIRPDQVEGLDLILVSKPHFTPKDLFAGDAMTRLMKWARQNYDIVLIDSPPTLGVADARTLASIADTAVMTIRWGKTPPMAVETSLAALRADGVNVAGVLLSMVDPDSEAIGGMYYSRKYTKYYQTA